MDQWFTAALEYAREKGNVGGFLVVGAVGYLALRFGAKAGAVISKAADTAWTRYDKLLTDWEEMNRRKNEELRAKDLEIRELSEQLRQAREALARRTAERRAVTEEAARARRSRRGS